MKAKKITEGVCSSCGRPMKHWCEPCRYDQLQQNSVPRSEQWNRGRFIEADGSGFFGMLGQRRGEAEGY